MGPSEFGVGDANANCPPRFSKNTARNSPKHAIVSEKFNFFLSPPPLSLHSSPPDKTSGSASASPKNSSQIDAHVLNHHHYQHFIVRPLQTTFYVRTQVHYGKPKRMTEKTKTHRDE